MVQFISIPMLILKKVDNMQVVLEILLISLQISKKRNRNKNCSCYEV